MSLTVQVTFDCADPAALVAVLERGAGLPARQPPAAVRVVGGGARRLEHPRGEPQRRLGSVDPDGKGPRLWFQKVPEGKSAKNRVHLDVRAAAGLRGDERMAALEAKCAELRRPRRHPAARGWSPTAMSVGPIVMQDPEGNEFCLD